MTEKELLQKLADVRAQISDELTSYVLGWSKNHASFYLDTRMLKEALQYSLSGKMFRGFLLYSSITQLDPKFDKKTAIKIAAAIELYGSAILMHDDIMDEDELRRGYPTIHTRFATLAAQEKLANGKHFGISSAICLGDVLFFMAGELLMSLNKLSFELRTKLVFESHREMALLGLSQVEDLRMSYSSQKVTKKQILDMYHGKTARYTGEWPLKMAAIATNSSKKISSDLEKIGDAIGVLYQLRDDYLGLFGDAAQTGKQSVSDILEGKKTLYYYFASELPKKDVSVFYSIYGNSKATKEDIASVKKLLKSSVVEEKVNEEVSSLLKKLSALISKSSLNSESKIELSEISKFIVSRSK